MAPIIPLAWVKLGPSTPPRAELRRPFKSTPAAHLLSLSQRPRPSFILAGILFRTEPWRERQPQTPGSLISAPATGPGRGLAIFRMPNFQSLSIQAQP